MYSGLTYTKYTGALIFENLCQGVRSMLDLQRFVTESWPADELCCVWSLSLSLSLSLARLRALSLLLARARALARERAHSL